MQPNAAPDTIVMIHGLWMTSRSWEHWSARAIVLPGSP